MTRPLPDRPASRRPTLLLGAPTRGGATTPLRAPDAAYRDVTVLALAARMRLEDPAAERVRDAALTELYEAAFDLAQHLRDHTRHSLTEYRGSHSAWDVVAESTALFEAQERYAAVARHAADRLRPLLGGAAPAGE